jgi:hypothetical protein
MQAGFQIRTSREQTGALPSPAGSPVVALGIRFLTDSKELSCFRSPLARTYQMNGLGRATSEMPANLKVFHPEAPRRDL